MRARTVVEMGAEIFNRGAARERKLWMLKRKGRFVEPVNPVTGEKAMPFWAPRRNAEEIKKYVPAYVNCESFEISWEDFVNAWVPRLENEGIPVGVNWGGMKAQGMIVEPAALVKAVEAEAEDQAIYNALTTKFDRLARKVFGPRNARFTPIRKIPRLARDLYLIMDLIGITCNAGMGAWVHYHCECKERISIQFAIEASRRIGHPKIGEGLDEVLKIYLEKRGELESRDDEAASVYIFDNEKEIIRSLYEYLKANGIPFSTPPAASTEPMA